MGKLQYPVISKGGHIFSAKYCLYIRRSGENFPRRHVALFPCISAGIVDFLFSVCGAVIILTDQIFKPGSPLGGMVYVGEGAPVFQGKLDMSASGGCTFLPPAALSKIFDE